MSLPLVVVVAYHADDHLERCLRALGPAQVIVVDNDGSERTRLIAEAAGARYEAMAMNVGFAGGVNAGLRAAWNGSDDVLLLNPDALVSHADLQRLQADLLDRGTRCAAVGPRLVGSTGAPQLSDWPIPTPGQVLLDAVGLGRHWRGARFVVGAALLLRGAALAELGGMDERFFLYAEETDWQHRAQLAGWTIGVAHDVIVRHVGGASSTDDDLRSTLFHASGRTFAAKWYGLFGRSTMRWATAAAATRRMLAGPATDRAGHRRQLRLALHGAPAAPRPSVVHVVRSDAFAGVERYIVDTAGELVTRGWRVHVIGGAADRMRAELPPGATHEAGRTTIGLVRTLWRLGRCDVVHAHMTAAEVPAVLLRRRIARRVVVTRHFAAPRGTSLPGRMVRPLVHRLVDVQISISRYVANAIAEPSTVVPNGVRSSTQGEVTERDRTVLVLQRLEPEKDTAAALHAWAASGLGEEGWRLVVHGRGSEIDRLRNLAITLRTASTVEFGGVTDEPRAVLSRVAILLATAVAEPFGLAVVEAMAQGTPVVATDAGAHPETLGEDGVYFAVGDVASAARALRRLADDPADRAARGRRLQERQRCEFDLGTHVDRLEALYQG